VVIALSVRSDPALENFALPEVVAKQLTVPGRIVVVVNRRWRWKETEVLTLGYLRHRSLPELGRLLD
jgi:hypothetical protein